MKIGILTLPLHTNYGGILQAYALQTVLERMGHEVVIIDEPIRKGPKPPIRTYFKRLLLKIKGKITTTNYEQYYLDVYHIINAEILRFINNNINRVIVDSPTSLNEKEFDALVVGSDQIWRCAYYNNIEDAYLNFAKQWKNVKRIAYAPSFGTDDWEYSEMQTKICKELIGKFDAVSVREKSAIMLCRNKFNVTAQLVLDPTLLIEREFYIKMFALKAPPSNGELLHYILDKTPSMLAIVDKIAENNKYDAFSINGNILLPDNHPERYIKPSVESWIRGFYDAKLIVTDSFHACVFSMIFNKPFVVVGNKTRGMARFESLLSMFGQDFRLIDSYKEYLSKKEALMASPNIQNIIDDKKTKSLQFLKKAL